MKKMAGFLSLIFTLSLLLPFHGWAVYPPEEPIGPGVTCQETKLTQTEQYANEVVKLVNEERAKNSLKELTIDEALAVPSSIRAREASQSFSHTRPDGTICFTVLKENNVDYRKAGENLAMGQTTPKEVMDGWMQSKGHRANILSPDFESIGVCCYTENGIYYWVQIFRKQLK